ncbi:Bax inhibitor-1/YccA family protein [Marinobacteraceae bacterium S3BR75-40.1]
MQERAAAYQSSGGLSAGYKDEVSSVLRNTYMLLGMTLAFAALMAWMSMSLNLPYPNIIVLLVGFYGLLFATHKLQNSPWALVTTFALTGFMGYTLGPIIGMYVSAGAGHIVAQAFTLTAITFVGLSGYVLVTRKDMSFLSGMIMAGFWVLLGCMILSFFISTPAFQLAISGGFAIFSSMIILFQTSQIIHGGERNYILATVTLFVALYNLFISLLNILTALSGDD